MLGSDKSMHEANSNFFNIYGFTGNDCGICVVAVFAVRGCGAVRQRRYTFVKMVGLYLLRNCLGQWHYLGYKVPLNIMLFTVSKQASAVKRF
jgi:hypothetical protein